MACTSYCLEHRDMPTVGILSANLNEGYGRLPIPADRDQEITDLLESSSIANLSAQVSEEHFATLRAYAERMASYAVRSRNPTALRWGLTALGLAGTGTGSPDALTILPLHYHAAKAIGAVPESLFRSVGAECGGQVEAVFKDFLERSDEDKSLEAMGFHVGRDEHGFRYEREW